MTAVPKTVDLRSPTFLGFTRRRPCAFCGAGPFSEPHHFPPRGRGVTDDTKVIPVCRRCHARCHGGTVDGMAPIDASTQHQAVAQNLADFVRLASRDEWKAMGDDRARRLERLGL